MQGEHQSHIKYYMNFPLHQKEKEWVLFYKCRDRKGLYFI